MSIGASIDRGANPKFRLSPRQEQIVSLIALGRTNQEVARTLMVSDHTVASHLQRLYGQTGLHARAAVVAAWVAAQQDWSLESPGPSNAYRKT